MPQFGVRIDEERGDRQFVSRGDAPDESAAMAAAQAAWATRNGAAAGEIEMVVLEVEPGDSGYEPSGA